MVVKLSPDKSLFGTGITRIDRRPGETQEQFDATKDQATYQIGADTHTLVLDGKIDEALAGGLQPGYNRRLLSDIRDLAGKTEEILHACKTSEDWRSEGTVDLGTGAEWTAFPNTDPKTHLVTSYDLIEGPGPQEVNVRLLDDGMIISVSSKDQKRELGHSMSAHFSADGSCNLVSEGVSWQVAK